MASNRKLLVLPGDGIGVEVMRQVHRVVDWFDKRRTVSFDVKEGLVGGAAIDKHDWPIDDATMDVAMNSDATLFGAVGGPKWDGLPFEKKPERGLLRLRKDMDLFANLRPALVFDALADASSLKRELVSGLDILILRELTGGVYFGEPRGVTALPDGQKKAVDTQVYTTSEIQRIARVAFELARKRGNKVHSVEKSNVMHTGVLWREVVTATHKAEFADVTLEHMLADNASMQMLLRPGHFDVLLCENTFGDLLSDEAAALAGSLGMLPSASLNAQGGSGRAFGLYEPAGGTAPDIAGRGIANPIAQILSAALLLRHSLDHDAAARAVERAVAAVIADGKRTGDIRVATDPPAIGTREMGEAIIAHLHP